jgi:hypothetical protein
MSKSNFASTAKAACDAACSEAQIEHALKMARRYLRFCRESPSGQASRYTMEDYLRMQGVKPAFIPDLVRMAKEKYAAK